MRRVDMDEFLRSSDGQWLETFGLATCTGLLATCANNVAYLAHISPRDRVYGESGTNLLGQMIKRIDTFDRCPDNRRCTEYTVVATHLESLPGILTKMIESGIFLSQIRVLHNSQAESAAMVYDHQDELLQVLWRMGERQTEICTHQGQDAVNLGEVLGRQFSTAEGAL